MVFEYARVENQTSGEYKYPIYYKISDDPENADGVEWQKLVVDKGTQPNGGPFATWSPVGGPNGTIIVSDSSTNPVWVNNALGGGIWKEVEVPHGRAYSREVRIRKSTLQRCSLTEYTNNPKPPKTRASFVLRAVRGMDKIPRPRCRSQLWTWKKRLESRINLCTLFLWLLSDGRVETVAQPVCSTCLQPLNLRLK